MCGISGILSFKNNVSEHDLKKMTNAIVHRGPDGEGHWVNSTSTIGLGHRRLSIIDLSEKAKQPMHYANERYTITFNGEIYNYIELKETLLSKGYIFNSDSDTEVLLALYNLKKEKCLDDLDGMFAFAIWDEAEKLLFCARDRFGEKPFFYTQNEEFFCFASEMKSLWAIGIPKQLRSDRMMDFISSGMVEAEKDIAETFYYGIKKLDAAHFLKIDGSGNIEIKKYWSLNEIKVNQTISLEEATKTFYSLFENSIRVRLRSDVSVGSSLSGGLDSSAIVTIINKLKPSGQTQKTFSARFNNFEKDEGNYIELVTNNCKELEVFYTWPEKDNLFELIGKAAYHQEEPFASSSILAQWKVMELAKENNITVLLDGQGADEQLAGYLPEYRIYLNQLFFENRKNYLKEYNSFIQFHNKVYPLKKYNESETLRMKLGRMRLELFGKEVPHEKLKSRLKQLTAVSGLKELLRYADRNSMAHSREVRLPFLSHKLVEFVFSLPDHFLLHNGWTKFILRNSMDAILPKEITWRVDKIGYEPPQKRWMQNKEIEQIIIEQKKKYDLKTKSSNDNNWELLISSFFN